MNAAENSGARKIVIGIAVLTTVCLLSLIVAGIGVPLILLFWPVR